MKSFPESIEGLSADDLDSVLDLLLMRGDFLVQAGDLTHALEVYHRILDLQPDRADAWIGVGAASLELGLLSEAERAFGIVLSNTPNCCCAAAGLAMVYAEHGCFADAMTILNQAKAML